MSTFKKPAPLDIEDDRDLAGATPPNEQMPGDAGDSAANKDALPSDEGLFQNILLTCGDFLPDRDKTWPNRNIASQPQGFRIILGSVAGTAHGCERRTQEYKGKPITSIWLHGTFVATVRATGEVIEGITLIPPQTFAAKVERLLQEGGEGARVAIDIDIGLEATGRTIPTRWFSVDYSESKERDEALRIAAKHKARLALPHRGAIAQRLLGSTD